jgi:hypothetical protein
MSNKNNLASAHKLKDETIKILTLPVRIGIGFFNAVINNMPDKVEFPFEIRKKEKDVNGKTD